MMVTITKLMVLLSLFGIMQPNKVRHGVDYSYLGEYCTPNKFSTLPCLEAFCAEIDKEMRVWATKNGSVESKFMDL